MLGKLNLTGKFVRCKRFFKIRTGIASPGNAIDAKIKLHYYLTHNDIAGIISTSRQTVSILFKEMKDSGLLFYNRRLIQLNDSERWN